MHGLPVRVIFVARKGRHAVKIALEQLLAGTRENPVYEPQHMLVLQLIELVGLMVTGQIDELAEVKVDWCQVL